MKILAAPADRSGCGYYRMHLPLGALQQLGHAVEWDGNYDVREFDIIVGQRVSNEQPATEWERLAAHKGRDYRLVLEIDDDLWCIEKSNVNAYEFYSMDPKRLSRLKRCVQVADLVTTTTEFLADQLYKWNPEIEVLPNYIDANIFNIERKTSEQFTVGVGGSPSHLGDWTSQAAGIGKFLVNNKAARMHFVGAEFTKQLPESVWPQVEFTPWVQTIQKYYHALRMDVGLAPLRPNLFNASKSNLKALEYAALGIPSVVTSYTPYRDFVKHGETGFLVNAKRPDEWGRYLRDLMNDEAMREDISKNARQQAEDWTIQKNAWRWEQAYASIL